jgi:hypothetical protein
MSMTSCVDNARRQAKLTHGPLMRLVNKKIADRTPMYVQRTAG